MPTGFTDAVKDGISFTEFALQCARAFGACISLRDEPLSAEIPEFKPSDYHHVALRAARNKLAELQTLTPKQATDAATCAYNKECERYASILQERKELRTKYETMLARVEAWQPPTAEHEGLKKFMREQLTCSIENDCDDSYYSIPLQQAGTDWLARQLEAVARSIKYHEEEQAAEVLRVVQRNAWVRALRASLE